MAYRSEVSVKPRGIQVSTYHAHSRQSERQNAYLTAIFGHYMEDILTTKYDFYLYRLHRYVD